MAPCKHPAHRLFAGYALNEQLELVLWIGCCECGEVLQGGATLELPAPASDAVPTPVPRQEDEE